MAALVYRQTDRTGNLRLRCQWGVWEQWCSREGGSVKAWHDPPIMLDQSVSEPHLEVDSDQETKTVAIPEAQQTSDTGNVSLFVCGLH